jgi:DNA-binding protein Fis
MSTTLRDRIKAALDAPRGTIDFGGVGRELLTLVLTEIDRLEEEAEANESSAQNLLRVQRDALHKDLVRVTAERDAMREKMSRIPGHTCTGSGESPMRGCAICDAYPKPETP